MRRSRLSVFILSVIALGLIACGGGGMRGKINDARIGVGAGGTALKAADTVVSDLYRDAPPEDTEAYCRNKIAGLIFTQAKVVLVNAADVVKLWEEAWLIQQANKEAGKGTKLDEGNVLSSESDWMRILTEVASVLHGMWATLKLWIPDKIPTIVDYAVSFVVSLSGKPVMGHQFDFTDLEGSVCMDYLPGGGGS